MKNHLAAITWLCAIGSGPVWAEGNVSVPLQAKLIIESPQKLDPARAGADFRKRLESAKEGKREVDPLPVRVVLRLRNTGQEAVTFRKGSDASQLDLRLEGPGVVDLQPSVMMTREFRMGKPVTIAPGETMDLIFPALGSGLRGMGTWHYWTEPGTIRVSATYTGQLSNGGKFRVSAPEIEVEVLPR